MSPSQALSPRQKAAILIMSLPPELSAQVIRSFPPEEVQALTLEMAKTPNVAQETKDTVIKEFLETTEIQGLTPASGGLTGRVAVDEKGEATGGKPFAFLSRAEPKQIYMLIKNEHPQTVALILSHLSAAQATAVLQEIPIPLQTEVARRLAEIGKVRPEVLREVGIVLEEKYYTFMDHGFPESDGREALVEILNRSDRSTEEKILSGLFRKSPRLAKDLKNQLCEFEDLVHLDRTSIRQLLKVTDMRDLVLALKGASPEIVEKVCEALPAERAKAIQSDVESLKVSNWEEIRTAQQQVRNNLRGLIVIGKIQLAFPGEN